MKRQVVWSKGHDNLPNFIWHYFPNQDNVDICDFYYALMLMLLKPWQNIGIDLKTLNDDWAQSFDQFIDQLMNEQRHVRSILSGIQYFHNCKGFVERDGDELDVGGDMCLEDDHNDQMQKGDEGIFSKEVTEENLHSDMVSICIGMDIHIFSRKIPKNN